MSFSKQIKLEILDNLSQNQCCKQSFLAALIKSCGEFNYSKKALDIVIKTQIKELFDVVYSTCEELYNCQPIMNVSEDAFTKQERYEIVISNTDTKQLLINLGIAHFNEENCFELEDKINDDNFVNDCCKTEFVKGIIIGCGSTSGITEDSRSVDYHLECVFSNEAVANQFMEMLAMLNIFARKIVRKKSFVVYLQKFEQITDLLTLCGATTSMLDLNNEFAKRSLKNSLNRINNCENANISKTIGASVEQVDAISYIMNTVGLEALPDELMGICMLRLANTEESLNELAKLSGMSKSAINHRLTKVIKIAKILKED